MQGFLDHLEGASTGISLTKRQRWTRRFATLNVPFHTLELFTDATQTHRVARLELANADIATADALGELLVARGTAIPVEHTRRFVFRVAVARDTGRGGGTTREFHYFCAEQRLAGDDMDGSGGSHVDTAASRASLIQWVRALQGVAASATDGTPGATPLVPLDMRDVHAQLVAFTEQLHVSARVTARVADADDPSHKPMQYEISCQAWTLQRERVPGDGSDGSDDTDDSDGTNDTDGNPPAWQVLEYACAWRVLKTSAQLRDFDAQLRLRGVGAELRDLALPSFAGVRAFLHRHDARENTRRATAVDTYWQQLLCLPAFSTFGTDGSAMLDTFLELSRHLAGFKRIERESGQSLHLRTKRIVPWHERARFEKLFSLHQAMAAARTSDTAKPTQRHHVSRSSPSKPERRHRHDHHDNHRHGSRSHSSERRVSIKAVVEADEPVALPPAEVVAAAEPVDSVHARIARIGHKLLVEAFAAPRAP